jgi:hypothetical protein
MLEEWLKILASKAQLLPIDKLSSNETNAYIHRVCRE